MSSVGAATLRGVRYGVLPAGLVTLHYLLALDVTIFDRPSRLASLNLLLLAAEIAVLPVSFWSGKREAEAGGRRFHCLVAGAVAGMVGIVLISVVQTGLSLLDAALGITRFLWGLQGVHLVAEEGAGSALHLILRTDFLISSLAAVLVGGLLGGFLGVLGTLARRRRPRPQLADGG